MGTSRQVFQSSKNVWASLKTSDADLRSNKHQVIQTNLLAISRHSAAALPSRPYFATTREPMSVTEDQVAWLERGGEQHVLQGNCSIGRAALNTVVVDSPKVSRLHSVIHVEESGAFWLVDLGSSNGTYLNKRRIHEPVRLRHQDEINVGGNVFIFHQPRAIPSAKLNLAKPVLTLQEVENIECWLLVADIKNFTQLSRSHVSDELATLVSSWLAVCKTIIEGHRGTVNKYLGDGILAYWPDEPTATQDVLSSIQELKNAQSCDGPAFRFVVHFGSVAIGGVTSTKGETLMGSEVNLVFRLEKVLASLGESCGISDPARAKLGETISCRSLGEHDLKGFEKKRSLFAV
jgi:adenylate cyclase